MSVTDRLVAIRYKDVVTVHQDGTVADVNSRVPLVSMDGTALNLAHVRTVHIVMERMGGAYVPLDSRATNVSKGVPRVRSVRLAVKSAHVDGSSVTRRMGSVYVRLEDMEYCVRRSVEREDMERVV